MIGRLLCRWFGHRWYYQPTNISSRLGMEQARVCTRCCWRLCERYDYFAQVWTFDHRIDL